MLQCLIKLPPEDLAEHQLGQEEAGRLWTHPSAGGGEAPGRHNAMEVRMVSERLPPGVQYAQKAKLRAQVLRIRRHFQQRGRSALEQQVVEQALVLEDQGGE